MKILFTGGHITPTLAVIDYLNGLKEKKIEYLVVGRKYALDDEKSLSFEYKELRKKKIRFVSLAAGRLARFVSFKSFRSLIRIPWGFIQAERIICEEKPDRVVSFGGYLALPIVFWSFLRRIPVFTHEQTIRPGLANRLIGRVARKVFISFIETKKFFPEKKTIVVGNPIRKSVFEVRKKILKISKDRPVIYVTGGSLGSHSLNNHLRVIINRLLDRYIVIHQTGNVKHYHDFEYFKEFREGLTDENKGRYLVQEHFFDDQIGAIYSQADLVVSRAGANTIFELIALKKPAVLIPLPWSANREQEYHARLLEKNRVAELFDQNDKSENLLLLIKKMVSNLPFYQGNFKKLTKLYQGETAKKIVEEIIQEN